MEYDEISEIYGAEVYGAGSRDAERRTSKGHLEGACSVFQHSCTWPARFGNVAYYTLLASTWFAS